MPGSATKEVFEGAGLAIGIELWANDLAAEAHDIARTIYPKKCVNGEFRDIGENLRKD